jgi:hypothetical protein
VSIKDYFKDPNRRLARKIVFDKVANRFDRSCFPKLFDAAAPLGRGLYLAPVPRIENLISNLLPVTSVGNRIYVGETAYRDPKELWDELNRLGIHPGREWILRDKKIVSFVNLGDPTWRSVCDPHEVENFKASEWGDSDDPDRLSEFVQLLKWALRCRLTPEIRWHQDLELFYFPARWETPLGSDKPQLVPYSASYQGLKRASKRGVFEVYRRPDGTVRYCRHYAFEGQFRRYGGAWYLVITPSYHFTYDGERPDFYADSHLSGIKRLERNPAVLAALRLWAQVVARDRVGGPIYQYLRFGELNQLEIEGGIEDSEWTRHEEDSEAKVLAAAENQLALEDEA